MTGPPARCPVCGWRGLLPDFIGGGGTATNVTFSGVSTAPCPRCRAPGAVIETGTYHFIGDLVLKVREAGWTLDEVLELRDAALAAQGSSALSADEFAAANPNAAPIIQFVVQQGGRDWLVVFLTVVTIVLGYLQLRAAEHPPEAPPPATTTLTDDDVHRLADQVAEEIKATKPPPHDPPQHKPPRPR
jgi:hypothetical protein